MNRKQLQQIKGGVYYNNYEKQYCNKYEKR